MKALRFDRFGSLDALRPAETPTPAPGSGEALVRVRAAGLNPSDVQNVLGKFPYTTLLRTPRRDVAGEVEPRSLDEGEGSYRDLADGARSKCVLTPGT